MKQTITTELNELSDKQFNVLVDHFQRHIESLNVGELIEFIITLKQDTQNQIKYYYSVTYLDPELIELGIYWNDGFARFRDKELINCLWQATKTVIDIQLAKS